jgi:hypothetical protein
LRLMISDKLVSGVVMVTVFDSNLVMG